MDPPTVEFLNHRFLQEHHAWEGEKLHVALLFFWPEFGRCGGRKIPRPWRCVRGWRRVTLGKSRKPHALMTWQGMAADLGVRGFGGNLQHDQGVGVLAPFGGRPPPHGNQRAAARCGCQRILEPLAAPRRDCRDQEQELTTTRSCCSVLSS